MKYDETKDDQSFNVIFKNIHALGVELEGLFVRDEINDYWNSRDITHIKDFVNDGSISGLYPRECHLCASEEDHEDCSMITDDEYYAEKECRSEPLTSLKQFNQFLHSIAYPIKFNNSCGAHFHFSLNKKSDYRYLINEDFNTQFLNFLYAYSNNTKTRITNGVFKKRLSGDENYCKTSYNGKKQLINRDSLESRYFMFNFGAYYKHKTFECRLPSVMNDKYTYQRLVINSLKFIDDYLEMAKKLNKTNVIKNLGNNIKYGYSVKNDHVWIFLFDPKQELKQLFKRSILKSRYNDYINNNYSSNYDSRLSNTHRYNIFIREILKINTDHFFELSEKNQERIKNYYLDEIIYLHDDYNYNYDIKLVNPLKIKNGIITTSRNLIKSRIFASDNYYGYHSKQSKYNLFTDNDLQMPNLSILQMEQAKKGITFRLNDLKRLWGIKDLNLWLNYVDEFYNELKTKTTDIVKELSKAFYYNSDLIFNDSIVNNTMNDILKELD